MATKTFTLNGASTGTPSPQPIVTITITENPDGSLTIVSTQSLASTVGDTTALWFDVADESLIGSLKATANPSPTGDVAIEGTGGGAQQFAAPTITYVQGNDTVTVLSDPNANLNGIGYGSDGGFDFAVLYSPQPDRLDNYNTVSFTLSSTLRPLTLADFLNVDFGIRIMAAGADLDGDTDGDGPGSWKIIGNSGVNEPIPLITIDKSGPAMIDEGGDTALYTFTITASSLNAATDPLTIDSIVDNVFLDLTAIALAANGGNPIVLDPGESFSFSFTSPIIVQNAGTTHTNIVTVKAHDDENTAASDWDDHVITVADVDPEIKVVKSANMSSFDEGTATDIVYGYAVTNESAASTDPLTIDSILDDRLGALTFVSGDDGDGLLEQGETWLYTATATGVVMNTGSLTNVVTVGAHDDEGNPTSDDDTLTLSVLDLLPEIKVVKSANMSSFDEGTATDIVYGYAVTNESAASTDPLTIDSILDDRLGALTFVSGDDGDGLLEQGETWLYTATAAGVVMNTGSLTNVVTVDAHDDEGNPTSDDDTLTVSVLDLLPEIKVVKSANMSSFDEGTATDIVYSYAVTNESAASTDPLTIDSILDDRLGALTFVSGDDGDGLLEQGETWLYTATAAGVVMNTGSLTNVVTVDAHDDEGNPTSDDDTLTIGVNDVAPDISIVKTVDANCDGVFHDSETVMAGPRTVTYRYAISNDSVSTDPLTLDQLFDDKLGVINTSGARVANVNDNGDALFDAGETWIFDVATSISLAPNHDVLTNLATVTAHDDEGNQAIADDTAAVESFAGPGVRTPGFWSNLGAQFWDGVAGFSKVGPSFPGQELAPIGAKASTYLILGGDHDNMLEAGEVRVSLADAMSLINASTKQQQDGRWMLGRDVVASELNMRAGNPGTDTNPATVDPQHLLDDAVAWLDLTTNNDHTLTLAELNTGAVKTSDAKWNALFAGLDHTASLLHVQLDGYNNTGKVFGVQYANDGDLLA